MGKTFTRVVEFTDEELNAADDPAMVIVDRLRETAKEIDTLITPAMEGRGIDLKITMEVIVR